MKANISFVTDVLTSYDQQLRINIEYPEARREIDSDVVRFLRKPPGMNFISFTFAEDYGLERVIGQQLGYFLPKGLPLTWKVYEHDQRPILEEKLLARGFVCEDDDPGKIMVLDIDQASPALLKLVKADIRRVKEPENLQDVVQVLDRVYGNDNAWVYDRLGGHLRIPGYLSVYVAYVDAQPASVAWTYFPTGQFAQLFAGSTISEFRRNGLYTGLLATRLQEIRARGYRVAVVDAGAMSRPIVEKHGFEYLTTQYDYEWKGQDED